MYVKYLSVFTNLLTVLHFAFTSCPVKCKTWFQVPELSLLKNLECTSATKSKLDIRLTTSSVWWGYSLVENLIKILQDLLYNKIGLLVMYLFCENLLLCFQMIFFNRPLLFEIIVYYQGVILNMFMHCFKSLIIILNINMC